MVTKINPLNQIFSKPPGKTIFENISMLLIIAFVVSLLIFIYPYYPLHTIGPSSVS